VETELVVIVLSRTEMKVCSAGSTKRHPFRKVHCRDGIWIVSWDFVEQITVPWLPTGRKFEADDFHFALIQVELDVVAALC
jgi:hypothetical protein